MAMQHFQLQVNTQPLSSHSNPFPKIKTFYKICFLQKQRDDGRIQRRSEEASEQDDGSDG